jgi:hypothetical protein
MGKWPAGRPLRYANGTNRKVLANINASQQLPVKTTNRSTLGGPNGLSGCGLRNALLLVITCSKAKGSPDLRTSGTWKHEILIMHRSVQ